MTRILLILLLILGTACKRETHNHTHVEQGNNPSQNRGPETTPTKKPVENELGGTSGGGHTIKENSLPLLEFTKNALVGMLERTQPQPFENLPNGWTTQDIAEVISNITEINDSHRPSPTELMFDYTPGKSDEKGQVFATKWYFLAWAQFPFREYERTGKIYGLAHEDRVKSLMLSMLHEVSHLILQHGERKTDNEQADEEAKELAFKIMNTLERDFVVCQAREIRFSDLSAHGRGQTAAYSDVTLYFNLPHLMSGENLDSLDNRRTVWKNSDIESLLYAFNSDSSYGIHGRNNFSGSEAEFSKDSLKLSIVRDLSFDDNTSLGVFEHAIFPRHAMWDEEFQIEVETWSEESWNNENNNFIQNPRSRFKKAKEKFSCKRYNQPLE